MQLKTNSFFSRSPILWTLQSDEWSINTKKGHNVLFICSMLILGENILVNVTIGQTCTRGDGPKAFGYPSDTKVWMPTANSWQKILRLRLQDLDSYTTPMECGRAFRCKMKSDIPFIGREALQEQVSKTWMPSISCPKCLTITVKCVHHTDAGGRGSEEALCYASTGPCWTQLRSWPLAMGRGINLSKWWILWNGRNLYKY